MLFLLYFPSNQLQLTRKDKIKTIRIFYHDQRRIVLTNDTMLTLSDD